MDAATEVQHGTHTISIPAGVTLPGDLTIPVKAKGLVIFAHGSGSSRLSSRNQRVAEQLQAGGFATLLFDLLTPAEEAIDARTGHLRFNIPMLADRLVEVTSWIRRQPGTSGLPVAYFGASTGAAAALIAAAIRPDAVRAVVSRGGRPDLAGPYLPRVEAPTLLIVGGDDTPVIAMNQSAMGLLINAKAELVIVPGATHLFEEPGTLDRVSELAREWFTQHLATSAASAAPAAPPARATSDDVAEIC